MYKKTFAVFTSVLLAAAFAVPSNAAEADDLREARDRAEIQELMWRYVRALDTLNEDAYIDSFTKDGQFISGTNVTKGREALKTMVINIKNGRAEREANGAPKSPQMRHVITNSYVEFIDKDHASYHSYWMTVFEAGAQDTPPRVAAVGRGIDELVRVSGRWLIKSRNVAPQD